MCPKAEPCELAEVKRLRSIAAYCQIVDLRCAVMTTFAANGLRLGVSKELRSPMANFSKRTECGALLKNLADGLRLCAQQMKPQPRKGVVE